MHVVTVFMHVCVHRWLNYETVCFITSIHISVTHTRSRKHSISKAMYTHFTWRHIFILNFVTRATNNSPHSHLAVSGGHIASRSCHSNVRLWRHCGNWDSAAPSGCGRVSLSAGPPLVVGAAARCAVPGDSLLFFLPTCNNETPTHRVEVNLLKPTGHVMHQQFNIQQLYALPTLYLCVLYLSENKQRLVPLTA